MPVIISFDFTCKEGNIKGVSLYTIYERAKAQPTFPGSKIRCDLDTVEVLVLSDPQFKPKIFWSDEVFGSNGKPELLNEKRKDDLLDIALIELRQGVTWIMRSEPTMNGRIGIVVFDSSERLRLTGLGDLAPIETPPIEPGMNPEYGYIFSYYVKEVYSWGTRNPAGCSDCGGGGKVFTNKNQQKQLEALENDER